MVIKLHIKKQVHSKVFSFSLESFQQLGSPTCSFLKIRIQSQQVDRTQGHLHDGERDFNAQRCSISITAALYITAYFGKNVQNG